MARKNRLIFTNNEQSDKGIMSLILGVICVLSLIYGFVVSYVRQGEINDRFGSALFVTLILSVIGIVLGVLARYDTDKFKVIPTVGIVVNTIVILTLGFLLWIGLN